MLAALQPTPSYRPTVRQQLVTKPHPQQKKRTASTPMTRPNSASSQRAPRRSSSSRMKAEQDTTMQPGGQAGGEAARRGGMLEGRRVKSECTAGCRGFRAAAEQQARRKLAVLYGKQAAMQVTAPRANVFVSKRTLPDHSLTCPQRQRAVGEHIERLGAAHRLLHNKCRGARQVQRRRVNAQQAAEWAEGGAQQLPR